MSDLESLGGMRARAVGEISERRRRGRLGLDGLNSCGGSHRWGYKDPTGGPGSSWKRLLSRSWRTGIRFGRGRKCSGQEFESFTASRRFEDFLWSSVHCCPDLPSSTESSLSPPESKMPGDPISKPPLCQPNNVPSFWRTSVTTGRGSVGIRSACRARQSRLLTRSESTTPVTGSPAGIATSKGYPLI